VDWFPTINDINDTLPKNGFFIPSKCRVCYKKILKLHVPFDLTVDDGGIELYNARVFALNLQPFKVSNEPTVIIRVLDKLVNIPNDRFVELSSVDEEVVDTSERVRRYHPSDAIAYRIQKFKSSDGYKWKIEPHRDGPLITISNEIIITPSQPESQSLNSLQQPLQELHSKVNDCIKKWGGLASRDSSVTIYFNPHSLHFSYYFELIGRDYTPDDIISVLKVKPTGPGVELTNHQRDTGAELASQLAPLNLTSILG
jgi:hypothetical protein